MVRVVVVVVVMALPDAGVPRRGDDDALDAGGLQPF
jgi:hypothetical protein